MNRTVVGKGQPTPIVDYPERIARVNRALAGRLGIEEHLLQEAARLKQQYEPQRKVARGPMQTLVAHARNVIRKAGKQIEKSKILRQYGARAPR